MSLMLGARWDHASQVERFKAAAAAGLIDYAEVNYPIDIGADPFALGLRVLAHTSYNPTCSALGVPQAVARRVKEGADRSGSPWIGEHLSVLAEAGLGSLGYQINPLFTPEVRDIAIENVTALKAYYGRPVALELGPAYVGATAYQSEMHFQVDVAKATDCDLILDVTHWQITNRNLGRPVDFGFDALPQERIVELHVAGMRLGSDKRHWHDAHHLLPPDEVIDHVVALAHALPNVRAVTFEHDAAASEQDFIGTLERLARGLAPSRGA
jgi:uncharacterized protein (UPF0276 family)